MKKKKIEWVVSQAETIQENKQYRLIILHPKTRELLADHWVKCKGNQWSDALDYLSHLGDIRTDEELTYDDVVFRMREYFKKHTLVSCPC